MREMEGRSEDDQCQETVPSMVPMAPEGRPIEDKKENAVVSSAVHLERVQPMVKKCLVEVMSGKAAREETNDARCNDDGKARHQDRDQNGTSCGI
jgi:hypothetical protein